MKLTNCLSAIGVWVLVGSAALAGEVSQVGVKPVSFEAAAKRHDALVKEYKENAAKIEQLTARNEQIMVEVNYLSGYLDALLYLSRTLDQTGERDGISSTSRLLRLPPPNWSPGSARPAPASAAAQKTPPPPNQAGPLIPMPVQIGQGPPPGVPEKAK